MSKEQIIDYLDFAMKNNCNLKIQTKNNKFIKVNITSYTSNKVIYEFINNRTSNSLINFENIMNIEFLDKKDKINFRYYILGKRKYGVKNLKNIVQEFEKYYLELIDILLNKEETNSIGYKNLKLKENVYPEMFKHLVNDSNNLLLNYFTKNAIEKQDNLKNSQEILLIEQANPSQKIAIDNALTNRVSIIEGPPGTGKTTTILNILANLVYQNKKVLIVSKNNSAIENVAEELEKMDIPKCYIRMGNSTIMSEELEPNIDNILLKLNNELNEEYSENLDEYKQKIIGIIEDLNIKENKLNKLIEKRNELQELKNQLRHIRKKSETYNLKEYETKITKKYKRLTTTRIKKIISSLAKVLIILDEKNKLDIFDKIVSYFILKMTEKSLKKDGIAIHLLLEEYYLKSLINEIELELKNEKFEELKKEIARIYSEQYIPMSRKIFNNSIKDSINKDLLHKCIDNVLVNKDIVPDDDNRLPKINSCKNDLLDLYPIVLTTVDSIVSNYWGHFYNDLKIDYIIIDEASQCDVLSALPVLYLAKHLIVVGDLKQLSAITNIDESLIHNKVEEEFNYTKQNFLKTITQTINPVSQMLLEHYRCDYNIINFCNKFFYENKLKIYKDSKKGAMSIIDNDKGKYVERTDDGYRNQREIKTINEQINYNIDGKFIITPFRLQADTLRNQYGKEACGTIHTFQGKGEKQVYFSAVLNDTKECRNHLSGTNNLFSNELINVAVSRAKDKFVLVADKQFFKKNDENMKNLIEYIEIYGDIIPDKTVCIFDYLYKEINSYQQIIKNIDNIFEEKVYYLLCEYLKKNNEKYKLAIKLPLAEFVSDKKFLDENQDLKEFVLSNSHLDFSLYSESINKPVLAIEVDGKTHNEEVQKVRDEKKEKILDYMNIPLLRIPSKVPWNVNEFEEKIEEALNN